MIVSPASRMFSAISFGVFCRSAPSTSAIMRSRNVSPGLEVIRTLIQSDSTRVPPVTAERSPPDSRITGADSPVMADSSTDATPSMISPSPGMNSPADTSTMSPARSFELGNLLDRRRLASIRFAIVSDRGLAQRVGLRLAAAFRHRFGEVGEQHGEPEPERDLQVEAEPAGVRRRRGPAARVVSTLPTSTTNMTGFPIIVRGCSFTNAVADRAPDDLRDPRIDFELVCSPCVLRRSCPRASGSARRSVRG